MGAVVLAGGPCPAGAAGLARRGVLRVGVGALALAAAPAVLAQAPVVVRCPRVDNDIDQVSIDLLRLALARAPGAYEVQPWALRVERSRALHELARGRFLDVAWAVTSREREAALLPVRIPLDRGLSGWRLALVRQADVARFADMHQLADLASLRAGQGYDWVETAVLRANGLPVVTGNHSVSLPAMLAAHRFDYYPRPLRQAWVEAQQYAQLGLVVEPRLALHFPSALYFFVHRSNTALAAALEHGLRKVMADGTFERQFLAEHGSYIRRAALAQRRIFQLNNPVLPPETPLQMRDWWYQPAGHAG